MQKTKIPGLITLFRFELSFAAGACVLLGELLALGALPSLSQATFGFISMFCISATALILNDYFDVETDRVNSPGRPIPSGAVTKREALSLSIAVAVLGFLSAWRISVTALGVVALIWIVGFLYNRRFKRNGLLGNLFVAFSVGMTFIYGGIVAGNASEAVVWYLAVTTFLVDLGEEIAADALDVEGDRLSGSRSLAVVYGPEKAMRIATTVFGLVVVGSAVPFVLGWLSLIYLPVMIVWDAIVIYSARRLLDTHGENRLRDVRRIYLSGLGMIIAFIFIRIAL